MVLALQHVHDAPVPPRQMRPGLAKETEAVVLKAMAKDPRRRYQTASEFRYVAEYARSRLVDSPLQAREPQLSLNTTSSQATSRPAPVRNQEVRDRASAGRNEPERTDRRRGLAWIMAVPALLLVVLVAGRQNVSG